VQIEMSLTAPACPVAGELPKEVSEKVSALDKVGEVTVKLVWDPSWSKDMMSDDAKLLLDM
jgi:metal-sulfur cluster biosynthetic enzyme